MQRKLDYSVDLAPKQDDQVIADEEARKQNTRTRTSMQATVNDALAAKMGQANGAQMPVAGQPSGWGNSTGA